MKSKILIVDKEENGRKKLTKILVNSYSVIVSDNINTCTSTIHNEADGLCAVIISINTPTIDLFQFLSTRYTNSKLIGIPVIIIAADADPEIKRNAVVMGANDFITGNYTSEDILQCIKKNTEQKHGTGASDFIHYDTVTGIYKRETFLEIASHMIEHHDEGYYVISCFDIDKFKIINDQYGFSTGDEVLRHVASGIDSTVKKIGGICCRITGDDFGVLYPASYINSEQIKLSHKDITSPTCIPHRIQVHIGRYIIDDLSIPVSLMFDRASMAAKSIKGKCDSYIASFTNSMRLELLHEQQIINDMYEALESNQFVPWFQPQYNHATGALIGAEALVRWKKSESYVSPADFVPIFERNGFIYEMDQYIWEQTCKIMRRWIDEGKTPLPVSVNISRCDVFHKHFVEIISGIVDKYNIPYNLIRLEITESAFSESTKQITEKITQLIDLGFTVEIDDFGSGYSSLNTLKDVPASILKLDMKFFENTSNTQRSGNIIESVVRMARWLGMSVIAEGVEEKEQADYLKSIGCYYIQGYLYSKPIPAEEYEKLLDNCNKKEHELNRLKTVDNLNNNEFWNPKSMETLIFNSYIGGACIFEYNTGTQKAELLRTNDQYMQQLGILGTSKLNLTDITNIDEENYRLMLDNINNAINTGKESTVELMLSGNGTNIEYIRTTVRPIAQTYDRYLFYCVIVNMTEQRNAEKREHEYAQQLKVIMDNVNGGVSALIANDNGPSKIIFTNEKYYELFGYAKQEAEAENLDVFSLVIPEDRDYVIQKLRQLKQYRKPLIIDFRCTKHDGKVAYMRSNSSLMYIEGYGDDVIASVITDITEEKTTSARLKLLTNNIPVGILKFKVTSNVIRMLYISDGFYNLTGYTKDEYDTISSKNALHFIYKEDVDRIINIVGETIKNHKNIDCTFRLNVNGGSIRWVNLRGSLSEVQNKSTIIDGVLLDITEMKAAEDKLRKVQDKIRLSYERELNLRKEMVKDSHISLVMNLTTGLIEEYNSKAQSIPIPKCVGKAGEEHCKNLLLLIDEQHREIVRNTIFPDKLLEAYNNNQTKIAVEFRIKNQLSEYHWVKTSITLLKRPDSNEIIAFIYSSDIDIERKNSIAIKSILDRKIESAGILNLRSRQQHLINVHDERYYIELNKKFDQDSMIKKLVEQVVVTSDKALCLKYMTCQGISDALEESGGRFTINFHAVTSDGMLRYKQTETFYLDSSHEDAVIVTYDITDIASENPDL